MPYEDDYKMWLEDMLIKMNPDWLCDGMADKEFTHDWCEKYCGKDSDYITSKCLHIYYHHIARADRNSSEKPNNCEVSETPTGSETQMDCDTCRYYNSNIPCGSTPSACKEADKFAEEFVDGLKKLKPKDEPQPPSCETCRYNSDEWDSPKCDECIAGEDKPSNYEPQTDCQWK